MEKYFEVLCMCPLFRDMAHWELTKALRCINARVSSFEKTILDKGIMPSEKVLDFPVDCNTLTGSVNL